MTDHANTLRLLLSGVAPFARHVLWPILLVISAWCTIVYLGTHFL